MTTIPINKHFQQVLVQTGLSIKRSAENAENNRSGLAFGMIRNGAWQTQNFHILQVHKSMNTYRLESRNPFKSEIVYKIIKDIVIKECSGMLYDPIKCSSLAAALSAKIRNRIKYLDFERYRLVVFVEIGEKNLQGLQLVAKCLWDASRDNFATYTFHNTSLFVSATCFGIYQD